MGSFCLCPRGFISRYLNLRAMIDVVQQLLNGRLHKPFKCDVLLKARLTSQQLQKVAAQLLMDPTFINDINGMNFSAYDIEPNPKGDSDHQR